MLVEGGAYYEAAAYAWFSDTNVESVFVRVSWYASADGSGEAIVSDDSPLLQGTATAFRHLSTEVIQAPASSRSARVRLMLRPVSGAEAVAYFDDVEFQQTEEPIATPTPTDSIAATTSAANSPTVTLTPTQTPLVTATATPPPPPPTASPTPVAEPAVFAVLTNGGFEEAREDGTPYGWRKTGGSIASDGGMAAEGEISLALSSETDSTKWAYQVVSVAGSSFYEFAGSVTAGGAAAEAFLRVSWYTSPDGSGEAMSSTDSDEAAASDSWQVLRTSAVQAPAGARSAKVRLMLRPADGQPATANFDALTFGEVAEPDPTAGPTAKPASGGGQPVANAGGASAPNTAAPQVLGTAATPVRLANVRPPAFEDVTPESDPSDNKRTFWLVLAFGIPAAGFAAIGVVESRRRWLGRS